MSSLPDLSTLSSPVVASDPGQFARCLPKALPEDYSPQVQQSMVVRRFSSTLEDKVGTVPCHSVFSE